MKKHLSLSIVILLTVLMQHKVLAQQCNSAFTSTVNQNVVTFTAAPNSNGVYHYWVYGDGAGGYGSAVQNHTYSQVGTYQVRHHVQDSLLSCTDSTFQTVTITVIPTTCQASFYVLPDSSTYNYYNYMYGFMSTSTPQQAIQSLSWTLDGTYIGNYNGIYERLFPGTHQVCLTIVTTTGCTSTTCQTVTTPPSCNRTISFTSVASQSSPNQVTFTPSPNQSNLHYNWDFGDWNVSNQRIPTHTYMAGGTYSVKLVVHDSGYTCRDTIRQNITVAPPPPPPNTNCTANYTYVLNNQGEATFTATSNQNIVSQVWHIYNYTDSTLNNTLNTSNPVYAFTDTGWYQVCVQVTTDSACVATHCDWIYVSQVARTGRMFIASYPNPATGSSVQLDFVAERAGMIRYTVYDLSGTVIYQGQLSATTGTNIIRIPVLKMQRGQYFVDITCGDQRKRSIFQKL